MKIRDWAKNNPSMSEDVLAAGEYLESLGLEFLVHFGTGNALEKASKAMTDDLEGESWSWGLYDWE